MGKIIQLYSDKNKTIKAYPRTLANQVYMDDGKTTITSSLDDITNSQPTDLILNGTTLKLKKADGTVIGSGVILPSGGEGHTHSNKTVLDAITSSKVAEWNSKLSSLPSHRHNASEIDDLPSGGGVDDNVAWSNVTGKPITFPPDTHNHNYNNLTDKPTIPSKTSELTNDSIFASESYVTNKIAEAQLGGEEVDLSGLATKDELNAKADKTHTHIKSNIIDFAHTHTKNQITDLSLSNVAITGSYNDLSNKPTIPTVTNDLTNTLKSNYNNAYIHSVSTHAPANAEQNVQVDWNVTDINSDAYIKNKPTIPTQVAVTDSLTSTSTTSALSANQGKILDDKIANLSGTGNVTDFSYLLRRNNCQLNNILNVITFNTARMIYNPASLKEIIKNKTTNIVAYQEGRLNDVLENTKVYDVNQVYGVEIQGGQINILHSNLNMYDFQEWVLPCPSGYELRKLQRATIYTQGKKVNIYNCHFDHHDENDTRLSQFNFVKNILDNDICPYKILFGDFNVRSVNDYNIFTFGGKYLSCQGFNGVYHHTWTDTQGWGTGAIDNIIVSNNIIIKDVNMINDMMGSDHYPLSASLVLSDAPIIKPSDGLVNRGLQRYLNFLNYSNSSRPSTIIDESGNDNNAQIVNFSYTATSGFVNGGLLHDMNDDYVKANVLTTDSKTIEFAVARNDMQRFNSLLSLIQDNSMAQNVYPQDKPSLLWYFYNNDGATLSLWNTLDDANSYDTNINPQNGITNHFTITFESTSKCKLYLNGVFYGEHTFPVALQSLKFGLMTGSLYGYSKPFGKTLLKYFRQYNEVLTASEIKQNYDILTKM